MKTKSLQELKELKNLYQKEIDKIDKQIKKLQSKCKHTRAKVWYHERSTHASFYDGGKTVFALQCEDCDFFGLIYAGDDLFQFCRQEVQ